MSVAKQMLAIGHCYSGLVTVVIVATAIRMINTSFFKDLFVLICTFFPIFSTFYNLYEKSCIV